MKKTRFLLSAALSMWFATSCITSDELVTLTIQPDGSADWVRFLSNIRSSEKGDKGAEELKRFVADFERRDDPDCVRIRESGGEILEARWVRRQEPYSNVVTARLPGVSALQNFCTFKNEKGEAIMQGRFAQDGQKRKLTLAIRLAKDELADAKIERQGRQEQANGLSETRFAISSGQIIASRGFTVASDKGSALLDLSEVKDVLNAGGGQADLFLEWELPGK